MNQVYMRHPYLSILGIGWLALVSVWNQIFAPYGSHVDSVMYNLVV
jgi:hypothetical protein